MRNFTHAILYGLIMITTMCSFADAQTIVKGVVRDAVSKEPLQSVSIYIQDGKGVTTKEDGTYVYATNNSAAKSIKFSYVGYKTISKSILPNQEQTVDVELAVSDAKNT